MRIADKQNVLHHICDSCERALISPENPFTMDNPDMIVANGNNLFAIFIPTFSECENPDHLLRRVYMSMLGYGQKMTPVLLIAEPKHRIIEIQNNPVFLDIFRLISLNRENVVRFVKKESQGVRKWKNFSEIQSWHYEGYRNRLRLSEKAYKEIRSAYATEGIYLGDKVVAQSWSTGLPRQSKNYRHTQGGLMAITDKKKKAGFKTSFEQLMTVSFLSSFQFDNGDIYPTEMFNELSLLNTDWEMFDNRQMPNDYNRMLSFIGFVPVSVSTNREVEILFEQYQYIRKNGIG